MIEQLIIGLLFLMAIGYVARIIYKSYQGDAGCAKGCGCDETKSLFPKKQN